VAHPERAPTRSEFEDAFAIFAARAGLPDYRPNTIVAGHEADIYFPEHRLVVELDGYDYHSGQDRFEEDRDRDADLLAAGIATVRVTWDRMHLTPKREGDRLHRILAQRAASPGPPQSP
jgi:very-short-patch-repair endonuclease